MRPQVQAWLTAAPPPEKTWAQLTNSVVDQVDAGHHVEIEEAIIQTATVERRECAAREQLEWREARDAQLAALAELVISTSAPRPDPPPAPPPPPPLPPRPPSPLEVPAAAAADTAPLSSEKAQLVALGGLGFGRGPKLQLTRLPDGAPGNSLEGH